MVGHSPLFAVCTYACMCVCVDVRVCDAGPGPGGLHAEARQASQTAAGPAPQVQLCTQAHVSAALQHFLIQDTPRPLTSVRVMRVMGTLKCTSPAPRCTHRPAQTGPE